MNAIPIPKAAPAAPPHAVQAALQFESPEKDQRIPDAKRAECLKLLRELIQAVVNGPSTGPGGAHE